MECPTKCAHKLAGQGIAALLADPHLSAAGFARARPSALATALGGIWLTLPLSARETIRGRACSHVAHGECAVWPGQLLVMHPQISIRLISTTVIAI
jgi:hypothetical protein